MKINSSMHKSIPLLVVLLLVFMLSAPLGTVSGQDATPEIPTVLVENKDDYQVVLFNFTTDRLEAKLRTIAVYLPPGYNPDDKDRRYPVIYLHDGELLFTPDGSRDCYFDETLTRLIKAEAIEPMIAVAIYSSDLRWDELGPWFNANMGMWGGYRAGWHSSGEGDAYLDFVEDVKRYIDTYYNTNPGDTGIGGFSMGGLISLYAGLTRPEVFNRVMAMSPAVWFAQKNNDWSTDNHLIELIETTGNGIDQDVRFYMDIGTNEWADMTLPFSGYPQVWEEGVDRVFNALEKYILAENLHLIIEEGGVHEPYVWGGRFEVAMRWLYEGNPVNMEDFPHLRVFDPPEQMAILFTPTASPTLIPTTTPEIGEIVEPDAVEQPDELVDSPFSASATQTAEVALQQVQTKPLSFGWVVVIILFSAGIGLIVYVLVRLMLNKKNQSDEE